MTPDQDAEEDFDPDEVADEAADVEENRQRNKRSGKPAATRAEIAFEPQEGRLSSHTPRAGVAIRRR
ncbi:hypothetical protein LTR17_008923 [Elasticomyces elasticus]|nr:hypothetical protein LTR17_008923 [Elasticomyces elasticus]